MKENELRDYLANDDVMDMLKAIDKLNPSELPVSKVCTIKKLADTMGKGITTVWKLCDKGVDVGVLMYCGGILSRTRVDLTEFGENILDADGTEDLRKIIKGGI